MGPPQDSIAAQRPPQGFSSEGRIRRWVASPNLTGCCVFGLAYRVESLAAPAGPWRRAAASGEPEGLQGSMCSQRLQMQASAIREWNGKQYGT